MLGNSRELYPRGYIHRYSSSTFSSQRDHRECRPSEATGSCEITDLTKTFLTTLGLMKDHNHGSRRAPICLDSCQTAFSQPR